jgi:hypothetical protein
MAEESKECDMPATITTKADTSKYDALFEMFANDPDFGRLPLPECVRAKFNIPLVVKEIGIVEATTKALTSRYEYSGFELRDQTDADIVFPPLPPSGPPTESNVIMLQESEGHSNPPADDVSHDNSTESIQQSASQPKSDEEAE